MGSRTLRPLQGSQKFNSRAKRAAGDFQGLLSDGVTSGGEASCAPELSAGASPQRGSLGWERRVLGGSGDANKGLSDRNAGQSINLQPGLGTAARPAAGIHQVPQRPTARNIPLTPEAPSLPGLPGFSVGPVTAFAGRKALSLISPYPPSHKVWSGHGADGCHWPGGQGAVHRPSSLRGVIRTNAPHREVDHSSWALSSCDQVLL